MDEMSFFSVGKNEIQILRKKEEQLKEELLSMHDEKKKDKVCSIKQIVLKNEIAKIQNKLSLLSLGCSFNGDIDA